MKYQEINQVNGQIAIPAIALTRDIPLSALGMYIIITAHNEQVAFDDQKMTEIFYSLYDYSDYWKEDRELLVSAGMVTKPAEYVPETSEDVAARIKKFQEDLEAFDAELDELEQQA